MERKLLLLGLLQLHEMYGYQLHEIIDSHMGTGVQLKKPTVYKLLNQMADDGWLTYREEREGNRPVRRVYDITPEGKAAFLRLLRDNLATYMPAAFPSHIGLAFLDFLPPSEVLPLLQERRRLIEALLHNNQNLEPHPGSMQLVIDHQIRHLTTELEWLDTVIQRVENDLT